MSSRRLVGSAGGALLRFATAAIAVLAAVLAAAALTGLDRTLLGREFMLVTSGSMSPALSAGDIVVVRIGRESGAQVDIGEVITFRRAAGGTAVTHRVVAVRSDRMGRVSYVTKGDANAGSDLTAVTAGEVVGRVESVLPTGHLLAAMTEPRTAVPVVLAVVLLETALIVRPRHSAETNDPTQQQKAITQGGNTP